MCKKSKTVKKLAKEVQMMEDNFHHLITDLTGDLLYCNRTIDEMNQHHMNEKGRLSGRVEDLENVVANLQDHINALERPKTQDADEEVKMRIDPMPSRYPSPSPAERSVIPPEGIDMQMFRRDYPDQDLPEWMLCLPESFPTDEFSAPYGENQTMYASFIANAVFFGYGEPSKQNWEDRSRMIDILSKVEYDDLQFLMMVWADALEQGKDNIFVDSVFSRYEAELVDRRGSGPERTLEQKYANRELNSTYNHNGEKDG